MQADKDNSYGALHSTSIMRFNVEMDKLPVSADIFTDTFMKDVAATSVEDVIPGYSAGTGYSDGAGAATASKPRNTNSRAPTRGPTRSNFDMKPLIPAFVYVLLLASQPGAASAQLGEGWVGYSPDKKIHLVEKGYPNKGLRIFDWSAKQEVGSPTPCASYRYDAATETETFRLFDDRSNRTEIRLFNEYGAGSRQFEGYVTFNAPLNDESLFQVWGSDEGATQLMLRGYAANGGELGVANAPIKGTPRVATQCYGREIKVNVIHLQEDVGNKFIVFIDGQKMLEFPDNEKASNHDGKNYHKYGCYGTLKTGAVTVTWRRVRHYRDGRAPETTTKP